MENESNSPTCFILDDSILNKSGKCIEFIGKIYDHCSHSYLLGIKMLTLGFWDGKSFLPVDFSLHNELGKTGKRGLKITDLKKQFSKERNPNSAGFKRVLEVQKDKIQSALDLIKHAVNKGMKARYVLADSWFICEKFIVEILDLNAALNVIGMMKTNRKIIHKGKSYKANTIPEIFRKQIKYSKTFKCYYIRLNIEYKSINMNMYWVKMKGQNQWKIIVTSDLNLSFIKTMEYYQIRWSIEVFFKDCKQNLGLNNCQSTDFDAHIAHVTIIFMNYTLLSLRKRFDDYETLGELFRHTKENLLEMTMVNKIWQIIIELYLIVFAEHGTDLDTFVQKIIELKEENESSLKKLIFGEYSNQQKAA